MAELSRGLGEPVRDLIKVAEDFNWKKEKDKDLQFMRWLSWNKGRGLSRGPQRTELGCKAVWGGLPAVSHGMPRRQQVPKKEGPQSTKSRKCICVILYPFLQIQSVY